MLEADFKYYKRSIIIFLVNSKITSFFKTHFMVKCAKPAFMNQNTTETATRDISHLEQIKTTDVTKIQREMESKSVESELTAIHSIRQAVTSEDLQTNYVLRDLYQSSEFEAIKIARVIGRSFYSHYEKKAGDQQQDHEEYERDRQRKRREALNKLDGCALPLVEEVRVKPDPLSIIQATRAEFGADISKLIVKQRLDMNRFYLELLDMNYVRKEDIDMMESQKYPRYDMYARCLFHDMYRQINQSVDILVSVYQIYVRQKNDENVSQRYTRMLDSGLKKLQNDCDFRSTFLPPNYLECKPHVQEMHQVYQLCKQRQFKLPAPGTEDDISEKVLRVLQRYRLLHSKNISDYFPKNMIQEMQKYYDDFNG